MLAVACSISGVENSTKSSLHDEPSVSWSTLSAKLLTLAELRRLEAQIFLRLHPDTLVENTKLHKARIP